MHGLQHVDTELRHKLRRQLDLTIEGAAAIEKVREILAEDVDLPDSLDETLYARVLSDAQEVVKNRTPTKRNGA